MGVDGLIEMVMDSPKETWVVFRFVGAAVASTSEAFSLLDCVDVVAQVVLDEVDVSFREELVTGPASLSSSLVAEGGLSKLSAEPLGSSFTPRWF